MINIFFDMDGTLIDSARAIVAAVNEIRQLMHLPELSREHILYTINTPGVDWAKEFYNIDDFEHSSFKNGFEEYFIKHYNESVELFEGVKELLEFLKHKQCFLALATNAPQSSLSRILKKHNILLFFDAVVGVSDEMKPKPDPQMLHFLQKQAKYHHSVFIGDSQKDRECALNAKISYYNARWYEKEIKDDEFNSAEGLKALLEKYL
ncbi:HAD family hydrolase [Campylobacter sp. MIT 21-1685]|uniref:HAD family hydrolase n=1 Tax=unclassified Campylobacter TaxID=2593542 RepID=UPI00224B3D69|nr:MULTISPECIES: HAD family hydrolase [unclassified Campylobacter]MCX2682483.1 HAD family hydrolase [Campylobacter sp. MIT 21-1684]MCX2750804.1 HAD family hydrolase [Campylobacter sp. MIT 21-1682]MCX2806964.1 HAD family hydrolase [Campylobacter sp. MIT 21-1685]